MHTRCAHSLNWRLLARLHRNVIVRNTESFVTCSRLKQTFSLSCKQASVICNTTGEQALVTLGMPAQCIIMSACKIGHLCTIFYINVTMQLIVYYSWYLLLVNCSAKKHHQAFLLQIPLVVYKLTQFFKRAGATLHTTAATAADTVITVVRSISGPSLCSSGA